MTQQLSERCARLSIESRFENIEVVERTIVEVLGGGIADGDQRYWLLTAVREAVANAIRHGSDGEPTKRVHICCSYTEGAIKITVRDRGRGFDPTTIPDPTDEKNLLRSSGRGIFYMRRFMDMVEIKPAPDGGTLVTMSRDLEKEQGARNEESNS